MNTVLINDLIDKHGDTYLKCRGCSICNQIKRQAKERTPEQKFSHILTKGQDMTKSDIEFLLDNDIQRHVIRKALKMSNEEFFPMMNQLGLSKKKTLGAEEVAITQEKYMEYKAQGLNDTAIAKKIGMKQPTLSYYKKKWETPVQLKKETAPKPLQDKKEVATTEYESLKQQLAEKIKGELEKDSIIAKLEAKVQELEHLHNACEDVEKESARFRKERDNYLQQLLDTRDKLIRKDYLVENQANIIENTNKTLKLYEEENKYLKGLVKLWA